MISSTCEWCALLNTIHPWTSCSVYARTENERGVQTDERAAGPLSRGVCVPPPSGESAIPRTPVTPGMTYDLPYCRGTHRRRVYERIVIVCVRAQKRSPSPPRVRAAGNARGWLWREHGVAGGRLSPRGLHGYIISQGYCGLLLLMSS